MPDRENPRRKEGLEVNEVEDGLVIYDPGSDQVHHLNPSAALIFDLCDGSRGPDQIAELTGEAFALSAPPLEQARAGLLELAQRGLIEWEGHGAAAG